MKYDGTLFKNRIFNIQKLKHFGFSESSEFYFYKTNILENSFELTVKIFNNNFVDTKITEIATAEEYNLVYVKSAQGEFVGKVKEQMENILIKIQKECTDYNVFRSKYANEIIKYIQQKYNDEPEYLWKKFPNNAIFRRNDKKGKWYAAILTAKKSSIGINGDGEIEIIDLKAKPDDIEKLVDNKKFFLGYHMNKKHWYTICLEDETIPLKEVFLHIDNSYNML